MDNSTQALQDQISKLEAKIAETKELMTSNTDDSMTPLFEDEISQLEAQKKQLEDAIEAMNTNYSKKTSGSSFGGAETGDCIVEIRAGAGGDEAGLFANDLFYMYGKYAENQKWAYSTLSKNEGGIGNIKEISIEIKKTKGQKIPYEQLKYESGVHRVQRIPATETGGRIHTSTATVAVLPIVSEVEVEIKTEDLKIDTYRASGAGGQHVNKTESAIRITHTPTGLVVQCQDERSQMKNRERAMSMLRSKLYEMMQQQQKGSIDELRADQVGSGDRSEKIRTYNYPQDRITDHRVKKSWFNLEKRMTGDIDDLLEDVKEGMETGEATEDSNISENKE